MAGKPGILSGPMRDAIGNLTSGELEKALKPTGDAVRTAYVAQQKAQQRFFKDRQRELAVVISEFAQDPNIRAFFDNNYTRWHLEHDMRPGLPICEWDHGVAISGIYLTPSAVAVKITPGYYTKGVLVVKYAGWRGSISEACAVTAVAKVAKMLPVDADWQPTREALATKLEAGVDNVLSEIRAKLSAQNTVSIEEPRNGFPPPGRFSGPKR